jgi:hypothetical protein
LVGKKVVFMKSKDIWIYHEVWWGYQEEFVWECCSHWRFYNVRSQCDKWLERKEGGWIGGSIPASLSTFPQINRWGYRRLNMNTMNLVPVLVFYTQIASK